MTNNNTNANIGPVCGHAPESLTLKECHGSADGFKIVKNEQFDSLEVYFDDKPSAEVREALKALKFRWHNKKSCWYGFAEPEQVRAAVLCIESEPQKVEKAKSPRASSKLLPLWERCDASGLPGYGTDNKLKQAARDSARANGSGYDKEVAKIIRAELKKRFPECKFSVTSGGSGYLDKCNIVIKSGPYSFIEKVVNVYGSEERRCVPGVELQAVLDYCSALHSAFDADDGDHYADYGAHHDLYGGAEVSNWSYIQTEPTPEQLADIKAFNASKASYEAAQEAKRRADFERENAEREAAAKAAAEAYARDLELVAEIESAVTVRDLEECDQFIISGLIGGYGKPCNLDDLLEQIKKLEEEGRSLPERAVVSRFVSFPSEDLYNSFCNLFMFDFSFLSGKGGTTTCDPRVNDSNFAKLNEAQRDSVAWLINDSVAVFCCDQLRLVIDPEGYNYSRYVYLVPDGENELESLKEYERRENFNHSDEEFYFPAPMSEQAQNVAPGEDITVLSVDPWSCIAKLDRGTVEEVAPCKYAQHSDALRLVYKHGRKHNEKIIYNGGSAEAVVFPGFLPDIPIDLLYTPTGSGDLSEVNFAGQHVRQFIIECINYYKSLGHIPVIDNIQR